MKDVSPSIAVIVTCYNYEAYVGDAIDSLLAQTRQADEIIVVDDGSTDNSRAVIGTYGDRVRPILQQNQGHIDARINGFLASRSDVILFLDADDRLLPEALAGVAAIWRDDASKVQFDLEIIDAGGRALGRRQCAFPDDYDDARAAADFAATGTYPWPVTSGNAYARWFVARLLPVRPPQAQDGLLNTVAPLYGAVLTIPKVLGQYRLHGRNVSQQHATPSVASFPDFPKRIAIRRRELAILREQATALGVALPEGDLLDHELVFVNYRLMARRMKLAYAGDGDDSAFKLWRTGVGLLGNGNYSRRARATNMLWLTTLALSPSRIARALVELRFDRANRLGGKNRQPVAVAQ
jgi:hypothetical protein